MDWDADKVARLDNKQLENLRQNALRRNIGAIVELCDAELVVRVRAKVKMRAKRPPSINAELPIVGFHFVCDNENGVTRNPDGTFWSGTWVVDKKHAEQGLKINSYVALHRTKSDHSYMQRTIMGWRESPRERRYGDQDVKITSGVDFLVKSTAQPYKWVGDGAGEKGYARKSLDSAKS